MIAPDASYIDVAPSDCTDSEGRGLADLFAEEVEVIPLEDLDVRRRVDASDYAPLPCQCSSGDCACPGG